MAKKRELALEQALLKRTEHLGLKCVTLNSGQRTFCNATKDHRRIMVAGINQGGKTWGSLYLVAVLLTRIYPEWWGGWRPDGPIRMLMGTTTALQTRDVLTDRLLGPQDARGEGMIPRALIDESMIVLAKQGGVHGAVESFAIRDIEGNLNKCKVMSYTRNWKRMMGEPFDFIFLSEVPGSDLVSEMKARQLYTQGRLFIEMCPLEGGDEVYYEFERNEAGHLYLQHYTLDDATHLTEAQKAGYWADFPPDHPQHMPRVHGRPARGEGVLFTVSNDKLMEPWREWPKHWKRIMGLDISHTFGGTVAAVVLVVDPETDTWHITTEYKMSGLARAQHAERLRSMGGDTIPISWPKDGTRKTMDGQQSEAQYYRDLGLNLLPSYARAKGRTDNATAPILFDLVDRAIDGRLRVADTCTGWFREKATFRLKDGKAPKKQDDHLIDATVKAAMMVRYAEPLGERRGLIKESPQRVEKRRDAENSVFAFDVFGGTGT